MFLYAEIMAERSNEGIQLGDIISCPVCRGWLNDAKLLPCGHSYCLKCLEGFTSAQDVGETGQLECLKCEKNFAIPSGGLQCLPQNVYVDALVQLQETSTSDRAGCGDERDVTGGDGQPGEVPPASEKDAKSPSPVPYSAETSAEGCSPHPVPEPDATDSTEADTVVDLPRTTDRCKPTSPRRTETTLHCDQHADCEIAIYCRDCKQPMCGLSFINRHNGHRYAYVDELRDQLREDAEKIEFEIAPDKANLRALEEKRSAMLANVQASILY